MPRLRRTHASSLLRRLLAQFNRSCAAGARRRPRSRAGNARLFPFRFSSSVYRPAPRSCIISVRSKPRKFSHRPEVQFLKLYGTEYPHGFDLALSKNDPRYCSDVFVVYSQQVLGNPSAAFQKSVRGSSRLYHGAVLGASFVKESRPRPVLDGLCTARRRRTA